MLVNLNIHFKNTKNIGDKMSSPLLYFNLDNFIEADYNEDLTVYTNKVNVLIFGGGILRNDFNEIINIIKPNKTIIWGAGMSNSNLQKFDYSNIDFSNVTLIGLRDKNTGYDFVPCSSCMSPLFDEKYEIKNKTIYYQNSNKGKILDKNPILSNTVKTMREAIEFLASGETIVTSSYHGMYWGLLLGRKVEVLPFGAKFFGFDVDISREIVLDGFLEECRDKNKELFKKYVE